MFSNMGLEYMPYYKIIFKKIKCKTYFIVTHDSKSKYERKINKLDEYLLNKHEAHLSICNSSKNQNEIDNFIRKIK